MFHAFGGDETIREIPNGLGRTPHGQNFHARMVIEVHVQCRNNQITVVVLNVSQQALDIPLMVVIDQRNRSGDLLVPHLAEVFDKVGPDHICHSLRPVGIPLRLHQIVQLSSQTGRHADTEPTERFWRRFGCTHGGRIRRLDGSVKEPVNGTRRQ
jgi:hypothetical protein